MHIPRGHLNLMNRAARLRRFLALLNAASPRNERCTAGRTRDRTETARLWSTRAPRRIAQQHYDGSRFQAQGGD
jgi:hypothetical protein